MRRLVLLFASSTTLAVAVLSGASCSAPSTGAPIVTKRYGGGDDPPEAGHSIDGNLTVVDATSGPREDAGPALPGEVFAHTPKTLYKLEPISKTLTRVGNFSCTAGADAAAQDVIDIAVDKGGKMYGTTFQSLLLIDKATAACTIVATATALSFPNSLSFVPAGTVDPAVEALVGFAVDSYVKIDPATGAMTTIGNLNPNALGITFQSSGDIVSISGGQTYLTARSSGPDAGSGGDYLLEIDPSTGKVLKLVVDTQKSFLYGLGYWGGTAYAFSASGNSYAIDLSNGFTTLLSFPNGPLPDAGGWYGAGSTTSAPTR